METVSSLFCRGSNPVPVDGKRVRMPALEGLPSVSRVSVDRWGENRALGDPSRDPRGGRWQESPIAWNKPQGGGYLRRKMIGEGMAKVRID